MANKDIKNARAALVRAKKHHERASQDPGDVDEVFVWSFYALENAVVAAALFVEEEFVKSHWSKASAARKLARRHKLADVSDLLADLNEARKGTAYGDEDEPEISPEDVLENVGDYIAQVEALLAGKKR